jgi:hypothetical protein
MRTTHTRISLLRLAALCSFLPLFGIALLINPGRTTSGQGQDKTRVKAVNAPEPPLPPQEIPFRAKRGPSKNSVTSPNVSGGPDTFGYIFITSQGAAPTIPFSFLDISGTGTVLGSGDNVAYTAVLSQPFNFYGTSYNALQVSTNGYISTDPLDPGSDLSNDCPLPAVPSSGGGGRIYPLHDDLFLDSLAMPAGRILQQFYAVCPLTNAGGGTEPCTVIMWDNAQIACEDPNTLEIVGCGTPFDFEVILFHTSREIRVQVGPTTDEGAFSTTGIQDPTATTGLTVACNSAGSIPDNFAVSFVLCTAIACPGNMTVPNTAGQCAANVTFPLPTGNAGCGMITCTPSSGSSFLVGTTTVNCSSTAGPTCSFTVTVQDTQAPSITCPSNMTVPNTTGQCGANVTFTATATDNCSPPQAAPTVSCLPASGTFFTVGTTTVTCTASDASPNSPDTTCTFTVTVQDTQAPSLTCPSNITRSNDLNQCGASVTYTTPTATDNCPSPAPTVSCLPASGTFFVVGTTTVTCTASDASPNSPNTTCTFTVRVNDTQAPAITCPASFTIGATSASGASATYTTPTSSDNCPGGGTPTCTPASGATFPIGTTTVNCTVSDAAGNTNACSFTVTVNRVTFVIFDPLACTGPGNVVTGTFTVPNSGAAPVTVTGTVALPAGLVGLANSCTASPSGTCTVNATSVSYSATVGAGQTATVSFQAQVADTVTTGTQLCSTLTVTFSGGGAPLAVQVCTTANCPAVGPGLLFPSTSEVSDQKAGSVLVYNLYSSSIAAPNAQNTRVSITNIHPGLPIAVHLFFVDGATCSIADSLVCLTPNQTASFLASDIDPGTTGYIVAVASDLVTGCPVSFNYLIGDEYVKLSSGHAANLAAEGFAALAGGLTPCNAASVTTVLNFDGVSYNRAPRVLAASNVPSRADGNDTLIVLNRLGGSLAAGAATLGPLFGILYDDAENPLSFTFNAGVCQFRSSLSSNFPRVAPRFEQFIPAGRSGWAKFFSLSDIGLLGAQINFNANAATAANAFNQGHNLHKLTLTPSAVLTIPIFPPNC